MQKSSWMMLGVVAALSAFLAFAYVVSHSEPGPMTQAEAGLLLDRLKDAVARKDVNTIMNAISPDPETRVDNLSPDKLRTLLYRVFHTADTLNAQTTNVAFQGGSDSASLDFDLVIHHKIETVTSDWNYHVSMQLRTIETPQFLGLYHTKEWRIVGATADGPDAGSFLE